MPTPSAIIDMVASLQNDTAQTTYTDAACLPYLNIALDELQEYFELNNIPVTNETSSVLNCPTGTITIGFTGGPPALPSNLIEIQRLWESPEGLNSYTPLTKKEFLPHNLETGVSISQFLIWAWFDQEIHLIAAGSDIDLKLDYIKSIFATPIAIGSVGVDLPIINCKTFLGYRTAALCAHFIGANKTRADELNGFAELALDRVLGVGVKGKQSIMTKRRPFRFKFKSRSIG